MKPVVSAFAAVLAVAPLAVSAAPKPPAPRASATVRAPANTVVMVELAKEVSTKTAKPGDTFPIRLAEPLVIGNQLVLPAGTEGVGEVIEATKPGFGGKAAKLVLSAKSLTPPKGRTVPLKAFQLSGAGKAQAAASNALGLGGIGFAPLGVVAFAIKGGDVGFPEGTMATAKLASTQSLSSLGKAPKGAPRAVVDLNEAHMDKGSIALPPVPRGKALVVFFRKKTVMGTGQWFNVREDGRALGKLVNGAWFAEAVTPGLHTYTAKAEPEFQDKLKIKTDAGETYFVEGTLTKGVVIGIADLAPSDRAAFNAASKTLKPAPPPGDDRLEDDKPKG